jgi:hypothetical protein
MDLTDVYKIFHLRPAQYTSFSAAHGNFSKIYHILGQKVSLCKYKKIEMTHQILTPHNARKLELKKKSNSEKYVNNWMLNNTLLNDQYVIGEIRKEIKMFLKVNGNENTTYQNLWGTAKAILVGKFIAMNAYIKKTERSQIGEQMVHLKLLKNKEQAKPKTSRRREMINVRAKINEIKTKKIQKNQRNKNLVL